MAVLQWLIWSCGTHRTECGWQAVAIAVVAKYSMAYSMYGAVGMTVFVAVPLNTFISWVIARWCGCASEYFYLVGDCPMVCIQASWDR
jgi:uncharacterized membrane protein